MLVCTLDVLLCVLLQSNYPFLNHLNAKYKENEKEKASKDDLACRLSECQECFTVKRETKRKRSGARTRAFLKKKREDIKVGNCCGSRRRIEIPQMRISKPNATRIIYLFFLKVEAGEEKNRHHTSVSCRFIGHIREKLNYSSAMQCTKYTRVQTGKKETRINIAFPQSKV